MKKLIILFMFLFFSTQSFGQKGFNLGINITPQTTLLTGDYYKNPTNSNYFPTDSKKKFTLHLSGGFNFGYNFNNKLGIYSGLLYSKQGQKYDVSTKTIKQELIIKLGYLKFPLLFDYKFIYLNNISFSFFIGGQYLYLIDLYNNYNEIHLSNARYPCLRRDYNNSDINIVAGIGANYRIKEKLFLNIFYRSDFGFYNVYILNSYEYLNFPDYLIAKNLTMGLLIGMTYLISNK